MTRIIALLAVLAALTLASCGGGGAQELRMASADQTVVVTPFDLWTPDNWPPQVGDTPPGDRWFFYQDWNQNGFTEGPDNSLGSFVAGPGNPPQGEDSVEISVSGVSRPNLATYQFAGTPLADITELAYSTYNASAGNGGSPTRSGYLQFNVSFDGAETFQRRLIYVPNNNGVVLQNTWQSWDAINDGAALWGWSGYHPSDRPFWPGSVIPGNSLRTWSDIVNSYPSIKIRSTDSFLGIRVGEPYTNGYTENIDEFIFGTAAGTTTFDFERTSLGACKDHWKAMGFKNHGQCVSSFKNKGQQGQGN
jgi:hypothetical protein